MKYHKYFDHWTVLYLNGNKAYFKSEEEARHDAYINGIGLTAPLYQLID